MADTLSEWAERVQRETYEFWKENYQDYTPGFQVWYGPVNESKTTLILGIQPGGGERDFTTDRDRFNKGDFSLHKQHDYLTSDYNLASATRRVVPEEIIRQSVKTNLNFFRAPNEANWATSMDADSRRDIEEYCIQRVNELVQLLNPDLIITEGTASVYDKLRSMWEFSTDTERTHQVGNREERLYCVSQDRDRAIVGLKHPSSGRGLEEGDYQLMNQAIEEIIH